MDYLKELLGKLEGKHYVMIGLAALLLVIVIVGTALFISSRRNTAQQAIFTTPMPTAVTTQVVVPTQTMVPTSTQSGLNVTKGTIWVVKQTKADTVNINGFDYLVDVFYNEADPSQTMRAHCAEPQWPAPKEGDRYIVNDGLILVPCSAGNVCQPDVKSNLQRFWPMP